MSCNSIARTQNVYQNSLRFEISITLTLGQGRTCAIGVRRGSYKSLFLLNSGRFSLDE